MTFGRLLIIALLVTPAASCGASLIAGGAIVASLDGEVGAGQIVGGALFFGFFATMVSILIVLAALAIIAVPLTLLLQKLNASPLLRDVALIAVAALISAIFLILAVGEDNGFAWILVTYAVTTALLWVAGLRIAERRQRRLPQEDIRARFE
jgi:phosphoglycerol transferase MdoB-like AlkP superfamily enzyme